jgi:hypothetical protein
LVLAFHVGAVRGAENGAKAQSGSAFRGIEVLEFAILASAGKGISGGRRRAPVSRLPSVTAAPTHRYGMPQSHRGQFGPAHCLQLLMLLRGSAAAEPLPPLRVNPGLLGAGTPPR